MSGTVIATVALVALALSSAAHAAIQSPPGCNADSTVVNLDVSPSRAAVGHVVTFTVYAGNPNVSQGGIPNGCDMANRTLTLTLPDGTSHAFGPFNYPYGSAATPAGIAAYTTNAADLVAGEWHANVTWNGTLQNGVDSPSTGLKSVALINDATPPTITVPADIVTGPTGPSGAVVTFVVTASDPDDAAVTPSCASSPTAGLASGSVFPLGTTTITCNAADPAGNPAATQSFTVTVAAADNVSNNPGPGGTVATGTQPTSSDPFVTSVTTPTGGLVSIAESPSSGTPPSGFSFLGEQVQVTAPPGSVASPIVFVFLVDASVLAANGITVADVQVFHNGAGPIADCTDATQAIPDPCVASRTTVAGGDGRIEVRSSVNGAWTVVRAAHGFGGFLSPLPKATLAKSGASIPVKFTLRDGSGSLPPATAAALAANNQVQAILSGPGTSGPVVASALCSWDPTSLNFLCLIKTPKGLLTGTSNPYSITAQETPIPNGTTFANVLGTGNPVTVFFK